MQLVALSFVAYADQKQSAAPMLRRDGIQVALTPGNGYSIEVEGIPFSHNASLAIVDPTWTDRYYSYTDDHGRVSAAEATGTRIVSLLKSDRSNESQGTQTLELLTDRKLRIAVDIKMTSRTHATLENRLASIGEGWLSNVKWQATFRDSSSRTGQTPKWAPGATLEESTIVQNFSKAVFETRFGDLAIETSGAVTISLLDYRRNQYAGGEKYFWLGVLGRPMPEDDILSYEITFQFPKVEKASPQILEAALQNDLKTSVAVYKPRTYADRIIPTPKMVDWGKGNTPVFSEMTVSGIPVEIEPVVHPLIKRWKDRYGINLVAVQNSGVLAVNSTAKFKLPAWQSKEAYRLTINGMSLKLDCQTTAGLLNGFRTLEQLIRDNENGKASFRKADIFDYPSMPFRGIHFFTGKNARDLQIKMVSEILAPLKINHLVYQVDYMKWASQPQIHSDVYGMDKADARAVADTAESLGIDVVPLVNTFGHSEWLLDKKSMRHLADDPDDPYAYDPSNPEVYKICEGIYQEAIEMFHPSIMHIGHDEIHLDGFPKKPENQAVGATQLVINDIRHYHEFLRKQGIRTMMWGDMFLGPGEAPDAALAPTVEEAERRRSLLPKDIIITDWHYKSVPVEQYGSMAIFNKAGFDVIACPWYAPDNIVRLARASDIQRQKTIQMMGLLQTTWAGYSFDERSFADNLEQYAAYVLAAEAAWSGGTTESASVPFDYLEEFLQCWSGFQNSATETGWQLPLDKAVNMALMEADLNLADYALDGLQPGEMWLKNTSFLIPQYNGKPGALAVAGALTQAKNFPSEVTLPLNRKSTKISMLVSTPSAMPDGVSAGKVTMLLEDGTRHAVKLICGKNIMSITDGRQTFDAPLLWKSNDVKINEGAAVLHALNWINPKPESKVKQLILESDQTGPGLMLMGISGN